MKYDTLSSRINSKEEGFNSLLEAAAAEAGRISRAIQEVAGTTTCKGVQINGLKKWAVRKYCFSKKSNAETDYFQRHAKAAVQHLLYSFVI